MQRSFWRSGHTPTLFASFLYFDLSFMVWYLLGPLQVPIAQALGLDTQQRALMVAVPILCGAVLRLVLGMLADRIGAKRAGVVAQLAVIASLFGAWQLGVHSMGQVLLLGVLLGIAGASFAVALPLASRWYPPEHQGTAMGIAGAGNSGTVLAALFAPMLALAFGYQNVFGLACIPLVLTLLVFVLIAREAPYRLRASAGPITAACWLAIATHGASCFYSVTFGGFSGFASALPGYFHDQFGFDARTAGWATAACVLAGSVMRPLGGVIADRVGGTRALLAVYLLVATLVGIAGFGAGGATITLGLFVLTLLCLGAGNGAVFSWCRSASARTSG